MTLQVAIRQRLGSFQLQAEFRAAGGVTALFGRSGSGKTSLVNAVAGLTRPDTGRIALGDRVFFDAARGIFLPPHQRRIGYVFQDARLFPHLSVGQNLAYGRWFARAQRRALPEAEFHRIVAMLGIGGLLRRRPGALSGGERQRVALGRALLAAPELLLMDEPLAALDEARKAEILPYIERMRDEFALPVLLVSHSPAEVTRLASTLVLMEAGAVRAAGPVAEILADPEGARGLGPREAGGILPARVEAFEDGLARLATAGGPVWLAQAGLRLGQGLRLRILAQDVMLALQPPQGVSALNILPAQVIALEQGPENGDLAQAGGVLVQLRLGDAVILSRITRRSAQALGLVPGQSLYAVLKAMSLAPGQVGPSS